MISIAEEIWRGSQVFKGDDKATLLHRFNFFYEAAKEMAKRRQRAPEHDAKSMVAAREYLYFKDDSLLIVTISRAGDAIYFQSYDKSSSD